MYFELEDFRPDTPRSPSVISTREGILLSVIFHLALLVVYLVMPKSFFEAAVARFIPPEQEQIRYVHMEPLRDRLSKPKLLAEQSDQDRSAATREIAPKPQNTMPLSRGDTPEKVEGAPATRPERAAGAEMNQPTPPSTAPAVQDLATPILPETPLQKPSAASGSLGDKLRNLQGFLQKQNFDNERGGQTEQQADIQFDSKGIDFGPWLRRFRAQVMRNWLIPETAMYLKGHVVLQFYVHRDGTITELKVVQPSDVDSFTTSSFNAMKLTQQSRTAPLPPEYPTDKVLFTVTFYYNER